MIDSDEAQGMFLQSTELFINDINLINPIIPLLINNYHGCEVTNIKINTRSDDDYDDYYCLVFEIYFTDNSCIEVKMIILRYV